MLGRWQLKGPLSKGENRSAATGNPVLREVIKRAFTNRFWDSRVQSAMYTTDMEHKWKACKRRDRATVIVLFLFTDSTNLRTQTCPWEISKLGCVSISIQQMLKSQVKELEITQQDGHCD